MSTRAVLSLPSITRSPAQSGDTQAGRPDAATRQAMVARTSVENEDRTPGNDDYDGGHYGGDSDDGGDYSSSEGANTDDSDHVESAGPSTLPMASPTGMKATPTRGTKTAPKKLRPPPPEMVEAAIAKVEEVAGAALI